MKRSVLILAVALAFQRAPLWAARTLTVDDVIAMGRITDVEISPDGSMVAYTLAQSNEETHSKPKTVLYLISLENNQSWKIDVGSTRIGSPRWSPDGTRLAYLSSHDNQGRDDQGGSQIHVLNVRDRGEQQLTHHSTPVESFTWAPDGTAIAYLAAAPPSAEEQKRNDTGNDEILAGPGPDEPGPRQELWTVSTADGQSRHLDTGRLDVLASQWSPTGRQLLLTVADSPFADDVQLRPRLAVLDASAGPIQTYCKTEGKLTQAMWSPDGRGISFLGTTEGASDQYPGGLFICAGIGSEPRNVIPNSDFTLESYRWVRDTGSMMAVVVEGAHRAMARINVNDGRMTRFAQPPLEVGSHSPYSLSADARKIACLLSSAKTPPDIWVLDETRKPRQLTHVNPQLDGVTFGEGEEFRWHARDGLPISGVLIKPVGYSANVHYPLIVHVHGSPVADTPGFQVSWANWGQLLAANGYMVFLPNYRGSPTNGARFARANQGDLGGKDFTDIMDGVDALIATGTVDPERVGIGGVSYGGFLTAWAITQTTRFKAAVVGLGITDWISMAGQTRGPESIVALYWLHSPYEDWQLLWNRSPLRYAGNVKTPTLIYDGERDPIVNISQGRELFRALQHYSVPSQFILYPREGHGIAEPNHLRDNLTRIVEWFNRYLK